MSFCAVVLGHEDTIIYHDRLGTNTKNIENKKPGCAQAMVCASCLLGLTLSGLLYLRGAAMHAQGKIDTGRRCPARESGSSKQACPLFLSRSAAAHFYCGWEFNPQWTVLGSQVRACVRAWASHESKRRPASCSLNTLAFAYAVLFPAVVVMQTI